ncbi:Homocitrate synthase OS=Streptomyces sp. ACT-1 OX=1609288 GN=SACT1_3734 PE=4 SV=1 [Streptomyces griseus subsp. griseus]
MAAEEPEKQERPPLVSDATLRDSAHMAGVEFSPADAAAIADLLVRTGVELVEVGMVSGPDSKDAELVLATHEAVTPERSMTLVVVRDRRQVARALDEAERLGVRHIMYSIPTSEEHAQLKLDSASPKFLQALARSAIQQAKERGFHVTFSGEDGARTPRERLVPYVAAGFAAGADRFRLAETVAYLSPWQMEEVIADLTAIDGSEIEIHSHNMLGLAVANSLAAVRAGARWISATVGGIGERGGNAPLAEPSPRCASSTATPASTSPISPSCPASPCGAPGSGTPSSPGRPPRTPSRTSCRAN